MEKIDFTIEAICNWIQEELGHTSNVENSLILPEMTKALAELVSARVNAY